MDRTFTIFFQKNQPATTITTITDLGRYDGVEEKFNKLKAESQNQDQETKQEKLKHAESDIGDQQEETGKIQSQNSTIASSQIQQQHIHDPSQDSSETIPKTPNRDSKNLDLQLEFLHIKSDQIGEAETSLFRHFNGELNSGIEIGDKEDASEKGEADQNDTSGEEARGVSQVSAKVETISDNDPQSSVGRLHRRSSFAVRPPTLISTVFPWDNKSKSPTKMTRGQATTADVPLLRGGGVATRTKLVVEEKSLTMNGLRVAGVRAFMEVESAITLTMAPLGVSAREKQTMEERRKIGKQWKLLGLALLGFKWALVTHGLRLFARPNQAGHKSWINGSIFFMGS